MNAQQTPFKSRRRGLHRALVLAAVAACLAACTAIPVGSLWQLRKFDFEAFDPAELRVALRLPDTLALWPQGLRVQIKVSREAADAPTEESYWLRERAGHAAPTGLPELAERHQRWVVLQLDAADADRMVRMRQQVMASKMAPKASEAKGKSTLEVKAVPRLCSRGGGPEPSAKVSAAVRWRADPGYVILLQEQKLKDLQNLLDVPAAALASCDGVPPAQ